MTKTKSLLLAALALVAAGGATLASTDVAEARHGGFYRHGGHGHGRGIGLGLGLGFGYGLAAPVYAAPSYAIVGTPVRVCRTRAMVIRGVLQPVRTCRIVTAAY